MFCLGFSLLYQSPVPKVFSVMVLIFCFVMVMIRLGPVYFTQCTQVARIFPGIHRTHEGAKMFLCGC